MNQYEEALRDAMLLLASHNAVFLGQSVGDGGTKIFDALAGVPASQRIEFPVIEHAQLGAAIGMSLGGVLPVCVYPRINFMLEATGMIVSHLDKIFAYSRGGYKPKVIIRTAVGFPEPLDPGVQHLGDFSAALRLMLQRVALRTLKTPQSVREEYAAALENEHSTILVEYASHYER
jgi:pyruvate/2-oxoglutarate/acetoin dehydrogenase E1 component